MKSKRQKQHPNLTKIISNYLNEQKKENLIKSLPREDLNILERVMSCITHTCTIELNEQKSTPAFLNIYRLLIESKKNGDILPELDEIYRKNRFHAKNFLHIKRGKTTLSILGDQSKNYKIQKTKNPSIAQKILTSKIDSAPHELKEKYERLTNEIKLFETEFFLFLKLDKSLLAAEIKDKDIFYLAAYIILNPKSQFLSLALCDEDLDDFPLFWYIDHCPTTEAKSLFRLHKDGKDLSNYFELIYEEPSGGMEKIRNLINSDYLTPPTTHLLCDRAEIIKQVLHCYKNKLYCASICTSLIVIEGLLWDFSIETHQRDGGIYTNEQHNEIILASGKTKSEPTIGLLLQQSAFKNIFDKNFIKYFCSELYLERNPILHGRDSSLFTKSNASRKIATIEYLLHLISEKYKKSIHDKLNDVLPRELKDNLNT